MIPIGRKVISIGDKSHRNTHAKPHSGSAYHADFFISLLWCLVWNTSDTVIGIYIPR